MRHPRRVPPETRRESFRQLHRGGQAVVAQLERQVRAADEEVAERDGHLARHGMHRFGQRVGERVIEACAQRHVVARGAPDLAPVAPVCPDQSARDVGVADGGLRVVFRGRQRLHRPAGEEDLAMWTSGALGLA